MGLLDKSCFVEVIKTDIAKDLANKDAMFILHQLLIEIKAFNFNKPAPKASTEFLHKIGLAYSFLSKIDAKISLDLLSDKFEPEVIQDFIQSDVFVSIIHYLDTQVALRNKLHANGGYSFNHAENVVYSPVERDCINEAIHFVREVSLFFEILNSVYVSYAQYKGFSSVEYLSVQEHSYEKGVFLNELSVSVKGNQTCGQY